MSHPAINLSAIITLPSDILLLNCNRLTAPTTMPWQRFMLDWLFMEQFISLMNRLQAKDSGVKRGTLTPGENIILSVVVEPRFPSTNQQFTLSAAIAACMPSIFSANYSSDEWKIKWPNDLYWRDRKAGGILIESVCKGNDWLFAIVGIGININQIQFPDHIKNAVSLKQITGKTMNAVELAKHLCTCIEKRYSELKKSGADQLISHYNRSFIQTKRISTIEKSQYYF